MSTRTRAAVGLVPLAALATLGLGPLASHAGATPVAPATSTPRAPAASPPASGGAGLGPLSAPTSASGGSSSSGSASPAQGPASGQAQPGDGSGGGRGPAGAAAPGGGAHGAGLSKRYLRRLVTRLQGCLSVIAPEEARVLMLRTGVGVGRSYRSGEVARILGITSTRENQIERRAAAALQTAAGERSCAAAGRARSTSTSQAAPHEPLLNAPPTDA